MSQEKINDILLAVEWGHDPNPVAANYVTAFNKSGAYMILSYCIREPNSDEVEIGKLYYDKATKIDEMWKLTKTVLGTVEMKRLFVLVVEKSQKVPDHVLQLRNK